MDITSEIYKLENDLGVEGERRFDQVLYKHRAVILKILQELNERQIDNKAEIHRLLGAVFESSVKSAEPPKEELNRCPCCGNREIHRYCDAIGLVRYGCGCCFRKTNCYQTLGEAFEAWQAGENA